MALGTLHHLDAAGTLAAASGVLRRRRAAEVDDLRLLPRAGRADPRAPHRPADPGSLTP